MIRKMVPKLLNDPKIKKLFKKVKEKNILKSKLISKQTRYVSSSKSGVVTSGGLLSSNLKKSKKKLLGS